MRTMTYMTQVTGSDLIEVIEAGLRAQGEEDVEILRFLGGLRDLLNQPDRCKAAARTIQGFLDGHAEGLGICPHCGAELEAVAYLEHHPAGTERRREVYCPRCERAELAALRPVAAKKQALAG